MKPRIFYLTEFPNCYLNHTYFRKLDSARRFIQQVLSQYNIQGKVIKAQECPKTTKKKNQ